MIYANPTFNLKAVTPQNYRIKVPNTKTFKKNEFFFGTPVFFFPRSRLVRIDALNKTAGDFQIENISNYFE